ncbi:polyribonucleotide nucleotidyltransferase [Thermosipho africanus H17ap60334]|jgi:S1 RNA binding domain protein|uniref:Polyribonucleotide nucleotidyltransferase n=1 Tax=Thermosipho africanus (strain TCF52B) TaxID=484019 RepID=B7IDB5_THEAB|nr:MULTISPECIES: S1 RNA-binding domain-containing protein [Thermosipho]ACJ75992.1 polyribonucleotide nucleotidyltransferase [Thermosipho africanus TCF52B]EKF49554.1 polyribonucleotide nucleotidyltransferase [Thermosipho africanus H17ap60334]MBZ4650298.1 polyribonucleotide nucleotidyltransferase [Thermosipho sp. (in: thermotogales)]MDK2840371.1 binding domain protein [Thermosipho sp. (in: thermotogales)]MDK2900010.1 binding domain protein [Thermosipho sp. (in: thermotogales)]
MEVGQVVKGKVVEILKFGANIELEDGEKAFVHISKIAPTYVKSVSDHLSLGQEIEGKIVGKTRDGKWELTLKDTSANSSEGKSEEKKVNNDFEKKLAKFMKDSDRKLSEYRRRLDKKRGKKERR